MDKRVAAYEGRTAAGALLQTYQAAMKESVGWQVPITWLHKDGKKKVKTQTILVSVDSGGHRFAMHFASVI